MIYTTSFRVTILGFLIGFAGVSSPSLSQTELEPISPALRTVELPELSVLEAAVGAAALENRSFLIARLASKPAPEPKLAAELYGELGMLHHALGFGGSAAVSYDNAHLLNPTDSRWSYLLALVAIETGELDRAREQLARILAREPKSIPALLRLAEVYERRGDRKDAMRTLEQALSAGGEREAIRARLAGIEAGEERAFGETVESWFGDPLLESIRDLAESEPLPSLEGRLELRQGHYAEAAEAYYRLVALRPRDGSARMRLAAALAGLGDVIRAFDQYSETIRIDASNTTARFNLGVLLASQGANLSARHHLSLVAEEEPDNAVAHRELAHVLVQLGLQVDALTEFGRALAADQSDVASYLGAAQVLVRGQDFGQARETLESGLAIAPGNVSVKHSLARLLAAAPDVEVRDGERALVLAQSLLEEERPERFSSLVALALAESGRCDEAAGWQQRAIDHARALKKHEEVADLEAALPLIAAGPPCRP